MAYIAFFACYLLVGSSPIPFMLYSLFPDREPLLFGMLGASNAVIFSICIVGSIAVGFAMLSLLSRLGSETK